MPRAHLWSQYASTFEGTGVTAQHVKAHATGEDVAQGKVAWWQKVGNDAADYWAKAGARLHPLSDQDILEHKILHTFAKALGRYLAMSAAKFADSGLCDMESLETLELREQHSKLVKAELCFDSCVAKSFPPPPPGQNEGIYIFNGHHLVTSKTELPAISLSSPGIVWCRRCGAYISAGPGERARPAALLEGCRGKAAGAGLATQRRRALAG